MGRGDLHALIALVALAGGCVSPTSVECGEAGRLCPAGRTCHLVLGSETCVATDRLDACQGRVELEACADGEACFEGVCTPTGCGNRYTEVGESCDDGNRDNGDGCASDCLSNETCGNTIVDPNEQCDDTSPTTSRDGCARCREERPRWDVLDGSQLFVTGAAAAYDQAHDRTVIFGGQYAGLRLFPNSNETWELDGDRFTSRASAQRPPPRYGAAMAYDAARRRVVLFGGTTGSVDYNDTWEWDGDHWTRLAIAGPLGRRDHAMAYDPRQRQIVMAGGIRVGMNDLTDDTWQLGLDSDGVLAWRMLPLAKLPRTDHALVYDPTRDRLVSVGSGILELDGGIWVERVDTGFDGAMATFDPNANSIAIIDGPTMYRWDGAMVSRIDGITLPPLRIDATFTTDTRARRLVLFGGSEPITCIGTCASGDLWLWDGAWTELVANSAVERRPPPRKEMAIAHDHLRGRTYMFGGDTLDDTWLLEGEQWTKLFPDKRPSARSGARMVATPDGSIVLFGGLVAGGVYSDETWRFDGVTWTLLPTGMTPPGRKDHVMFYDATAQTIVLFGGVNDIAMNSDELGDAWTFDGGWRQVARGSVWPPDRSGAIAAWDFARARGVVFSGIGESGPLGDTWLWHDGGWELASSTNVPGPGEGALAWHAPRASLLLFGGGGGDELWEWNGTDWSFVLVDRGPTPRRSPQLVPTRDRRGVVMFGALDGSFDTWRFQYDAVVPYESCSTQLDLDGDGVGACADPDCVAHCARCGNMVCDAGETCASCPGDCGGCPTTCGDGRCDVAEPCPGDCP